MFRSRRFQIFYSLLRRQMPTRNCQMRRHSHPNHFSIRQTRTLNVPSNPLCNRLGRNRQIALSSNQIVGKTSLYKPSLIKHGLICYASAVCYSQTMSLTTKTSILVRRTAFSRQSTSLTCRQLRSASAVTTRITLNTRIGRLVVARFDPHCTPKGSVRLNSLLTRTGTVFPGALVTRSFLICSVSHRRRGALISSKL